MPMLHVPSLSVKCNNGKNLFCLKVFFVCRMEVGDSKRKVTVTFGVVLGIWVLIQDQGTFLLVGHKEWSALQEGFGHVRFL